ncbi:hypothetical protein P186_0507 [Pyrobaculum ferrireducens]|uniref:Uncharacterized protein n=1 Tax=Pyrobaculum ferrireducens TaxID=1104324 RepID=G7VGX6_9CREN|nr:hypothetical protein P186_0507 [Pyrobaculum ferrireducens]
MTGFPSLSPRPQCISSAPTPKAGGSQAPFGGASRRAASLGATNVLARCLQDIGAAASRGLSGTALLDFAHGVCV